MGVDIELHHRTAYRYDKPVTLGPQVIQLRPAPHAKTPILSYALELTPADNIVHWQFDALGNPLARVVFRARPLSL
jgi:transglutaminase-like putative cysteine protease